MDLKIKEVAELLNVSESTVRRWITERKIPAYRISQQYRFSRLEIEEWVLSNKTSKDGASFQDYAVKPEEETAKSPTPGSKQYSLYRAIYKGNVLHKIPGNTKEQVIANSVREIAKTLNLEADVLTSLLLDRENLQPTALNEGIGMPHTRDFLLSSHHDVVFIAYPEQPIEYGALDGKPVDTLFFLFACDDRRHLHLLAKIAHFCGIPANIQFVRSHPRKEAALDYIKTWEGSPALSPQRL